MSARIYKPAETAMQSGGAPDHWILEFEPSQPRRLDPLMGWTSSGDMNSQVKMKFPSKDAAVSYAERHGLAYTLHEQTEKKRTVRALGYANNFAYNRRVPWSH